MKHAAFEQGKPILVAAGGMDEVVPIAHSQTIAEISAKHSKISKFVEIPEATHGTLRTYEDVWKEVQEFIEQIENRPVAAARHERR
jgi:dipeptidyl aminopeptidase/acylaminoacyl peptidase